MRLAGASGRFWNTHPRNLSVPSTTGTGASPHLSIQVLFSFLSGQFEMLDSKRIGPIHVRREREGEKEREGERGRERERGREINVHVHTSYM